MTIATKTGSLILKDGRLTEACKCCECGKCCWRVSSYSGCPGPTATISNGGKEILLCFQDSANCGEQSCEGIGEDTGGCLSGTPCPSAQGINLRTTWTVLEPVTLTISLEGRVEVVDPGFDFTRVYIGATEELYIGSSLGVTDGGDCSMNFVQDSKEVLLEPGCHSILVESSTGDGAWHFGMYSKITFAFSDESKVAECGGGLCTTFSCGEDGLCQPIQSEGEDASLDDCVAECSQGECQNIGFYCCNEGECVRKTWRVCSSNNYGYTGMKSSDEKSGVEDAGDADYWYALPLGSFETLAECREGCSGQRYECINDVCEASDDPNAPYADLEACEQECLGRFDCSESDVCIQTGDENSPYENREQCEQSCLGRFDCDDLGKCVQTGDENSPYENRAQCEQSCPGRFECNDLGECIPTENGSYENREQCEQFCSSGFSCAPNGGCYRSADGPYATRAECEASCEPDPGGQYFCVSENGTTSCRRGPVGPEQTRLSGPHNGLLECQAWCRKHSCENSCGGSGTPECLPNPNGQYQSKSQCLAGCGDPQNAPCTLVTQSGVGPGTFPFTIDAAERNVCISYVSLGGQPVRVQAVVPLLDPVTCNQTGVSRPDSGWRGLSSCDCRDVRPPGSIKGGPSGKVSFRKRKGVTSFSVVVFAPCPDTEVKWTVQCGSGQCEESDAPEPEGACCVGGECLSGVKEIDCVILGGKWLGACTECEEGDCENRRGACCYPDGTCQRQTEASCNDNGGAYKGDGTLCSEVACPQPAQGACCFREGCTTGVSQADCETFGGAYLGDGTNCDPPNPCAGACCVDDVCSDGIVKADCIDILGGGWLGRGTVCEDGCDRPCVRCVNCDVTLPPAVGNEFGSGFFEGVFEQPVIYTWKEGYPEKLTGCGTPVWYYAYRQTIGMSFDPLAECPPSGTTEVGRNEPGKGFVAYSQVGRIRYRWRLLLCDNGETRDITDDAVVLESCESAPLNYSGLNVGPPGARSPNFSPCLEGEYCWGRSLANGQISMFDCEHDELFLRCNWDGQQQITELRPASPQGALTAIPTFNCPENPLP